jgi:hypothetical protein
LIEKKVFVKKVESSCSKRKYNFTIVAERALTIQGGSDKSGILQIFLKITQHS